MSPNPPPAGPTPGISPHPKATAAIPPATGNARGFSLLELIVSMGVLSGLALIYATMIGTASESWSRGERRVENFQDGRAIIELMTREAKGALASSRTQFAVFGGELLMPPGSGPGSFHLDLAENISPGSPAAFWVTPVDRYGDLAQIGYYLYRDVATGHFELKRLYISQAESPKLFPPIELDDGTGNYQNTRAFAGSNDPNSKKYRPDSVSTAWLLHRLDPSEHNLPNTEVFDDLNPATDSHVSTVASGVLALWIQAFDQQGNPIPSLFEENGPHPLPDEPIIYNSAAYFVQANSATLDTGNAATFAYTNKGIVGTRPRGLRANKVPFALEFTIVIASPQSLARVDTSLIPTQDQPGMRVFDATSPNGNVLDIAASAEAFSGALHTIGLKEHRVFSSRVKLLNGAK